MDQTFHADRLSGIGSSDAPVVMGVSAFKTPVELWLEKTGHRQPESLEQNASVHWGTVLEDVIAAEFARAHPELLVRRRRIMRSKKLAFALAHVDRMVKTPHGQHVPFEIKTSRKWDDWADGLPHYYKPQVQHQLLVTEAPFAYVAVLLGGQDYREFIVQRDEGFIEALIAQETAFWKHVVEKTPPAAKTYKDICALFPRAAENVTFVVDEALGKAARELALVKANKAAIIAREDELKLVIGEAMAQAETLVDDHGTPLLNYKTVTQERLDSKLLAAEQPEIFERYIRKVSYREMRPLKALKAAA